MGTKFTPGPWWMPGQAVIRCGVGASAGWIGKLHWVNRRANASLITAAPEMFEALEAFVAANSSYRAANPNGEQDLIDAAAEKAGAALRKAKGEA